MSQIGMRRIPFACYFDQKTLKNLEQKSKNSAYPIASIIRAGSEMILSLSEQEFKKIMEKK